MFFISSNLWDIYNSIKQQDAFVTRSLLQHRYQKDFNSIFLTSNKEVQYIILATDNFSFISALSCDFVPCLLAYTQLAQNPVLLCLTLQGILTCYTSSRTPFTDSWSTTHMCTSTQVELVGAGCLQIIQNPVCNVWPTDVYSVYVTNIQCIVD